MALRRVLVGERCDPPSGNQLRKQIRKSRTLKGFRMKPGFIYTVVRAISARINQNYDGWPADELKKSYHTFIGKPVFVNHENYDPKLARGVVVAARFVEASPTDQYIEVIQEIDAKRFPKLAHEIRTGGLDSVSMGAEAAFTICSYCKHRAVDETDMCDHVMFHKGEHLRKFNRRTGKVDDILVYESCHKLSFFELSYVFDPADETAVASKVLVASTKHGVSSCPPGAVCDKPEELGSTKGDFSAGETSGQPASTDAKSTKNQPGGPAPTDVGQPDAQGLLDNNRALYNDLMKQFPGSTIGTYRVDDYHEHDHGALDFMTSDEKQAEAVRQKAFDSGAPYVLWHQTQWNSDGSSSPMEDRGSPTQNHMDHVHIAPFTPVTKASPDIITTSFERKVLRLAGYEAPEMFPKGHQFINLPEGHQLHVFPPREGVPGIAGVMPDKPGEHRHEWVHVHHGQPINGGMADSLEEAQRDAKSSYDAERAAGELMEPGWDPDRDPKDPRYDPRFAARRRAAQIFERRVLMTAGYKLAGWQQDPTGESWARAGGDLGSFGGGQRSDYGAGPEEYHEGWMLDNPGEHPAESPYFEKLHPRAQARELADYEQGDFSQAGHPGYGGPLGPEHSMENTEAFKNYRPGPNPYEAKVLKTAGYKIGWGETEAPPKVDTLRPEGSMPEDDNDDFHEYVNPADTEFANDNPSPQELLTPDLEQAGDIDREQEQQPQQGQMPPGGAQMAPTGPPQPQPQMMTLQIPMPPQQGQIPMQAFARRVLAVAGYDFDTNVENATLENGRGVSGTSRKPRKGTTMGRTNTLAQRGKVASQGKRQHFAEGPYTDGGPFGVDDSQGEQEEAFVTQVPSSEPVDMPDDDTHNISNTEGNLVAQVNRGRQQLLADAKQLAAFQAGKKAGAQQRTAESISMERAESYDPQTQTGPAGNELLHGEFDAVGEPPQETQPSDSHQASRSLQAFEAFDKWLHQATGRQARHLSEVGIKRAAVEWGKRAQVDPRVLFPALGIVLRQARKNEAAIKAAAKKGAGMRKRAVDLEVAAPDGRVDVEAPVENVTDAEAQESQFDLTDFGHNAGDGVADPDLDTDSQFWAPGEGDEGGERKESRRQKKATPKAGGILAVRCAEAYIRAGLEPNTQERKYQLAGLFENMNRGAVQRDIALLERVAQLQSQQRQKVASGRTRGAGTPIPPGLTQGGTQRSASVRRTSANDPINDALLYG